MQNRYVGDIGDFGKYGLLRALTGLRAASTDGVAMPLGVVWYMYPDETHNSDGKYTTYLSRSAANHGKFRVCDPELYEELRKLVVTGNRHISGVRESRILPDNTAYFERCLFFTPGLPRCSRQKLRAEWIQGALETTSNADIIFVDPDNGITENANCLRKYGPKYVFLEDLRRFFERGQSLVVYHHLGRRGTAMQQVQRWAESLKLNLQLPHMPWSLWYHRGTARVYFVAAQEQHAFVLHNRLAHFRDGPWRAHFDFVG